MITSPMMKEVMASGRSTPRLFHRCEENRNRRSRSRNKVPKKILRQHKFLESELFDLKETRRQLELKKE